MPKESRTKKGIRNTVVALIVYAANILLQFVSRRVFIDKLGAEVLGLNTTAASILQFLNIAELGVGTAIICTLYKPLRDDDHETIRDIVSIQGWFYKRIAFVIILASIVLMVFFPIIFSKTDLPLWYAYGSFGVLLFSSLLSYFVNYRQVVLSADQNEYKVQYSYKLTMVVKVFFQILVVLYLEHGYLWWLVLEGVFAVIASILLEITIRRSYPYLNSSPKCTIETRRKYSAVLLKIKQMFFHKIGSFAISQSTPLIIYGFASLSLVAVYGNYMMVISGLTSLLFAMFNSLGAGVGNLVSEGDTNHSIEVFKELFSVRFWIVTVFGYVFYMVSDPLMGLWIGTGYTLDSVSQLLIVLIFYLTSMRTITDLFLYAYGMFQDIWAPVVESLLNVGLAILFGCIWGLPGILTGVLVSVVIIHFLWKPYFLFKEGFRKPLLIYIGIYFKHIVVFLISVTISHCILSLIHLAPVDSWLGLFIFALISGGVFAVSQLTMLLCLEPTLRHFISRFKLFARHA